MNKLNLLWIFVLIIPFSFAFTDWTNNAIMYLNLSDNTIDSALLLNNGTATNITYAPSILGNGSVFNNLTWSKINITNPQKFDTMNEITINLWVNQTDYVGDKRYVHKNLVFSLIYGSANRVIKWRTYNATSNATIELTSSNNAITFDNLTMITATFKSNNMSIYINGVLSNSTNAQGGTLRNLAGPITLGIDEDGSTQRFNGTMDEVMILNTSLDPKEISALYTQYRTALSPMDCFYPANNTDIDLLTDTKLCYATYYNVSFNSNATITLDMNGARIDYPDRAGDYVIDNVNPQKAGFIIKNGWLNGSGNANSGIGFAIFNADNNEVQNMTITNFEVNIQINGAAGNGANGFIINNSNISWSRGCLANLQGYGGQVFAYNSHFDYSTNLTGCFQAPHGVYIDAIAVNRWVVDSLFQNCTFNHNIASGFHTNGPSTVAVYGARNITIKDSSLSYNGRKGIDFQGCLDCTANGNTIYGTGNNGIDIRSTEYGLPYFTTNSTFKNNRFANSTERDIGYYNGLGNIFDNNTFLGGSPYNYYLYDTTNQRFTVYDNGEFNISYENGHTYSSLASFYVDYSGKVNLSVQGNNISIFNAVAPNDDVYNVTTGTVIYPNIVNQTVVLKANQKVLLGDFEAGTGNYFIVNAPVSGSSVANSIILNWSAYSSQDTYNSNGGVFGNDNSFSTLDWGFTTTKNITFTGFNFTTHVTGTSSLGVYVNGVLTYTVPNIAYVASNNYNINITPISLPAGSEVRVLDLSGFNQRFRQGTANYSDTSYLITNSYGTLYGYIEFNATGLTNRYEVFLRNSTTYLRSLQNVSIPTTSNQNNSFQLNISLFPLNLSTNSFYYFVVNASSNVNQNVAYNTSGTFNLSSNAYLNCTVRTYSGAKVNFTANLNGVVKTGEDSVLFDVVNGLEYILNISAASVNAFSESFNITSFGTTYRNATLQANNSINVTIYNAQTLAKITENLSVIVTSGFASAFSTVTGNILLIDVAPGLNEIKIYNENYSESRYSIVIVEGSSQVLNAYLTPVADTQNVTFTFYDLSGAVVEGLFTGEYMVTNSSYVLISSSYSDIGGKAYFSYNPLFSYMYNYSGDKYVSASFILNPPREDNYDITLTPKSSIITYNVLNISGSSSFDNVSDTLTMNYSSNESSISTFRFLVYTNNSLVCNVSGVLMVGGFTCSLSNYDGLIRIYGLADGRVFYTGSFDLPKEQLSDKISIEEASILSGILALVLIIIGATINIFLALVFGVLALAFVFWLGLFGGLTSAIITIAVVVVLTIAVIIRRRY